MCSSLLLLAVGSLIYLKLKKILLLQAKQKQKMMKGTFHCHTKHVRTGKKQENPVMEKGLSYNSYKMFFVTGKNVILAGSQDYLRVLSCLMLPCWRERSCHFVNLQRFNSTLARVNQS